MGNLRELDSNCNNDEMVSPSSAKEVDDLLFEILKAFEDVGGDDDVNAGEASCKKKHIIGKTLKLKLKVQNKVEDLGDVKVVNDSAKVGGVQLQRRLKDLSKEEHESKMRATREKLRQSYQRTLPKRRAIVLDTKDLPDLNKSSRAPTQASKRKLQNGSQPSKWTSQQQYKRRLLI